MLMAISILGALYKRRRPGQGVRLKVARQEAMTPLLCAVPFSRKSQSGNGAMRGGQRPFASGRAGCPSAIHPCKPGGKNDTSRFFTSRANPEPLAKAG